MHTWHATDLTPLPLLQASDPDKVTSASLRRPGVRRPPSLPGSAPISHHSSGFSDDEYEEQQEQQAGYGRYPPPARAPPAARQQQGRSSMDYEQPYSPTGQMPCSPTAEEADEVEVEEL